MLDAVIECLNLWNVGIISVIFLISVWKYQRNRKSKEDGVPKNVVLLYQVGRGPHAPSSSPFPLKLETFLRMHKIPYMNDHTSKFSRKGKTPWIKYNGVAVADSELSICYLKKQLNIPNEKLEPAMKASARAFQKMVEENLYWTMCYSLFVEHQDRVGEVLPMYKGWKLQLVIAALSRVLRLEMWGHGIGRHSCEDIRFIGKSDIVALSDYLGDKDYFLGDNPTDVDCAIFGMLAQIAYHMPGTYHETLINEEYTNLLRYCERMIDMYWPDWKTRCYKNDNPRDDMGHIYNQQDGCGINHGRALGVKYIHRLNNNLYTFSKRTVNSTTVAYSLSIIGTKYKPFLVTNCVVP